MAIRYKTTTTISGKPITTHRKIWILNNGPIPKNYHVHHKNGVKFDNRIENLELISPGEHCALHSYGRIPWNKGIEYGKTEAFKKGLRNRNKNYLKYIQQIYLDRKNGMAIKELAIKYNKSTRQIYTIIEKCSNIFNREEDK
jgi:hypothetical protein